MRYIYIGIYCVLTVLKFYSCYEYFILFYFKSIYLNQSRNPKSIFMFSNLKYEEKTSK